MLWGATLRSPHPRARHPGDRHRRGARDARRPRRAHARGRPRPQDATGMEHRRPAGAGHGRGPLPGRAGRDRRRRPPRDRAPRGRRDRGRLRGARRRSPTPRPRSRRRRRALHPGGNLLRARARSATATRTPTADVVVTRRVRGRHAGPGLPRPRVRRSRCPPATAASTSTSPPSGCTSTSDQIAASLGLPPEKVRLTLAGVGGAFGGARGPVDADPRVHARAAHRPAGEDGLLARGVVLRPRPPAPGADALRARRDPRRPPGLRAGADRARRRRLRLQLTAVVRNAAPLRLRARTTCPTRASTRYVAYTNNPPCGAMRGFGAVQVAFAHEAQMDQLAAALGMDPVELRLRNAMATGIALPTGQVVDGPAPGARAARARCAAMPLPPRRASAATRPARAARRRLQHHPRRGHPRGVGFARRLQEHRLRRGLRRLLHRPGAPVARRRASRVAEVHTAAAEVGQGVVTVQAQIARTELGVERVVVLPADTRGRLGRLHARRRARPR